MQDLADVDVPFLSLDEASFAADPFPAFAAARRQHPWIAKFAFGYVVTEYKAIRELLAQEDKMRMSHPNVIEAMGASDTPWGRFLAHSIQALSGPSHQRLRGVVSAAFTPRQANAHRPLIREVISRQLDAWAPRGAFDFEEFASYFPITVMCRLIGASPEVIPSLKSSLEILGLGGSMDRRHLPALQASYMVLESFVQRLVADRRAGQRAEGEPDLLDKLLEANREGGLTEDELYNLLIFLFVGGYDTSKNMLTVVMYILLGRPADYARCAEDPAFCRKVVEETLRYQGVASLPRILAQDIEFRGVRLPAETLILLPWSVIGRDPAAIEDADEFRPERPHGSPHMAFGLGPHICLGQFIARAQIEEGLHLIAQRLLRPRLAGPVGWRGFIGVWGLQGLPIAFEPAAIPGAIGAG